MQKILSIHYTISVSNVFLKNEIVFCAKDVQDKICGLF